jgi:hypothetical protein
MATKTARKPVAKKVAKGPATKVRGGMRKTELVK